MRFIVSSRTEVLPDSSELARWQVLRAHLEDGEAGGADDAAPESDE